MSSGVLCVLTSKSVQEILDVGGSQSWVLDRHRAKACKYIILCRNAKKSGKDLPERHHHAFMIGLIKDVLPSTQENGRWLVRFDEYVLQDFGPEWYGRNPVQYWREESFPRINFKDLKFSEMPRKTGQKELESGLTLEEAKRGLAITFGVKPSDIEIVIRG